MKTLSTFLEIHQFLIERDGGQEILICWLMDGTRNYGATVNLPEEAFKIWEEFRSIARQESFWLSWGSNEFPQQGMDFRKENNGHNYVPFRQTVILLLAAMNNEF